MKKNIFQTVLTSMFLTIALLAVGSVSVSLSAMEYEKEAIIGKCGIFSENDITFLLTPIEGDRDIADNFLARVFISPLDDAMRCQYIEAWASFTKDEKRSILNHLVNKGLLSKRILEIFENEGMLFAPKIGIGE